MYSAGVVLRFNFVSKVMPSNKARYYKALSDQAEMKEAYEKQLAEKQRAYDGLSAESEGLPQEDNAELKSMLDDCEKSKKVTSYEVLFHRRQDQHHDPRKTSLEEVYPTP